MRVCTHQLLTRRARCELVSRFDTVVHGSLVLLPYVHIHTASIKPNVVRHVPDSAAALRYESHTFTNSFLLAGSAGKIY